MRFACEEAPSESAPPIACRAAAGRAVELREERCAFSAAPPPPWARHTGRARRAADAGNRFGTLHEASVALFGG